jgi:UDPglucose--hexose-1-phosphate uridylyltransferase
MDFNNTPHRRKNILTGEWVLVSPHRTKRPWQGKKDKPQEVERLAYDPNCYLCPGNERAGGAKNPDYTGTYSFQNDFAALLEGLEEPFKDGLLEAESESGKCSILQKEFTDLGSDPNINHVQIFENKGAIMGCSNPHPHGQIWAQRSIPQEVQKKVVRQKSYWEQNSSSLLGDYLQQELNAKERIVLENESFVALVPYWAVWPFEAMIVPKRHVTSILELSQQEVSDYASILKALTTRYDNLFETSFPYSAGIHQAPTDGKDNSHWHMHMSFYPPLLRSAEVKKFMVGYEMFANPQRDITAEQAAQRLRDCATTHYSNNKT